MNSNELRIGNLVHGPRQNAVYPIVEISKLSAHIQFDDGDEWFGCDQLHSIPITEEWLLRFGFKREDEFSCILLSINSILRFQENAHGQVALTDNRSIEQLNIRCESIHQLQNLYFALTGTELKCAP